MTIVSRETKRKGQTQLDVKPQEMKVFNSSQMPFILPGQSS